MTNRREFVRASLGAGLALPAGQPRIDTPVSDYHRILDTTPHMGTLGNPRSWSLIERELHPFAPERVVIMSADTLLLPSWLKGLRPFDEHVAQLKAKRYAEREQHAAAHRSVNRCDCIVQLRRTECLYRGECDPERWFSGVKRRTVLQLAYTLADHYRVPYAETWAIDIASRELLMSTGFGHGFALAHQFQWRTPGLVPVQCPPADWWIFLYPQGTDWAALDEAPTYAILTVVFQQGHTECLALRYWFLTELLAKAIYGCWPEIKEDAWKQVAQLGRLEACRLLNHAIVKKLTHIK